MNTPDSNSPNKISRVTKNTKTRLSIIALFVLTTVLSTAASASSLGELWYSSTLSRSLSASSFSRNAVFENTAVSNAPFALTATVTTDKSDYRPGETAIITGSGFGSGDAVTLRVVHTDGTGEGGNGHEPWTVYADADGNFNTTWYVDPDDSFGSSFLLTAVGAPSGLTAQVAFTDGPVALQGQCASTSLPQCGSSGNPWV